MPRLIGDLIREGVVIARTGALCRVRIGDIESGDIPWLAGRAGKATIWSPPSIGEQVLVLCGEGDLARAIVLPGLFSNAHPAPADNDSFHVTFDDGCWIGYDPAKGEAMVALDDGTRLQVIPGKVRIDADLEVTGKVTADVDVIGGGKSLKGHVHLQVQPGQGLSGAPK
ncbi:phage baseplate assembly protein V [Sphingomonas panni]|uniref:phage baseplate assembly protein V n=1 Tax=Sphingomonas panni TaxID=237612 RepID=UPI001F5B9929|nr:phage baseplate assembly protein V [Sphingomonas panni]